MTFQRKPSSSYGEDSFEFVDYNAVSHLEHLVTSIEEAILPWGNNGVYSFNKNLANLDRLALDNNARTVAPHFGSIDYKKDQTIVVGNDVYKLTYHQHPQATSLERPEYPLSFERYYLFNTTMAHPLHRWSGLGQFFILAPTVSDSKQPRRSSNAKVSNEQQESQTKTLISACAIAFNNILCTGIPIFIPVSQARHDNYTGYMLHDTGKDQVLKIRFDSTVLPSPSLSHINSLKELFIQHLNTNRQEKGLPSENLNILKETVLLYQYSNWYNNNWRQWDDESSDDNVRSKTLPFGPYNDPLRTITLHAIHPLGPDTSKVRGIDDTDGLSSDIWELFTEFAPSSHQRASLSALFDSTLSSWQNDSYNNNTTTISTKESSGRRHSTGLMRNLLHAMGQNKSGEGTRQQTNSVDATQINSLVDTIFNTEGGNNTSNIGGNSHIKVRDVNSDLKVYTPWALGLQLKHGMTVPWRSLLWNLVVIALDQSSTATSSATGASYMGFLQTLWTEFVRRIRWYWENLIPIPNVNSFLYRPCTGDQASDGTILGIDLGFNILHQKLAMINCCIHQSIEELPDDDMTSPSPLATTDDGPDTGKATVDTCPVMTHSSSTSVEKTSSIPIDTQCEKSLHFGTSSDLSEGEFLFGSMDNDDDKTAAPNQSTYSNRDDQQPANHSYSSSTFSELTHPTSMHECFVGLDYSTSMESDLDQHRFIAAHKAPIKLHDDNAIEGRSHPHETLLLLKTKTPLWVPKTQCSGFMTEDMIQQQAETFEKLGTSEGATQQRAQLQSAQLSSDMQSFKAANPDAVLEDFVRWYSPKDWVEKGNSDQGCLSTRMSEPGNIWLILWKSSDGIPASRQPSLFNLVQEGEKALKYLEYMTAHEVYSMLLPTMGLIMYDTLASQPVVKYIRPVTLSLIQLGDELIHYPWDASRNDTFSTKKIVSKIKDGESVLCKAISLLQKLPKQYDLVERLLIDPMTRVEDGDERVVVRSLHKNEDGSLPQPTQKEYVLYSSSNIKGICTPQRQYILLKNNEMRLFDMFSEQ